MGPRWLATFLPTHPLTRVVLCPEPNRAQFAAAGAVQLILAAMRNCAADHGVQACACGALANLVQTGPSLPPHCRAAAGVAQGLTVSEWACVRVCSRVCVRCRGCHRRREGDCGGHRWREPGHRCAAAVQQPQPRRAACLLGTAQPRSEKRYALWCGLGTHVCMC